MIRAICWTVVLLLLGLALSVGLALLASTRPLTSPGVLGPPVSANGKYIAAAVYQGLATEMVYIDWYGCGVDTSTEPAPASWYPERAAKHEKDVCVIAQASGWPCFCLWREDRNVYDADAEDRHFHWVRRGSFPLGGQLVLQLKPNATMTVPTEPATSLPLLPLWPGLLADTAIYATSLLLIAATTRMTATGTRSWFRRWSGRCARCGYDRRGLEPSAKCPECGKPPPK